MLLQGNLRAIGCRWFLVFFTGIMISCLAKAEDENIIALYVSNAGMAATVGYSGETKAAIRFSMETSSNPKLMADPPSLAFNDSPLKFFQAFMKANGWRIQELLTRPERKGLPVRFYIAGAGVDDALKERVPSHDKVSHFIDNENYVCLGKKNKAEFFKCMFEKEINDVIPDMSVTTTLEKDAQLMAKMADQYVDNAYDQIPGKNRPDDVLMVHATTYAALYRVRKGTLQPEKFPQCRFAATGGSHAMGCAFKERHLDPLTGMISKYYQYQDVFERKLGEQENAELVCAIYSDPVLHDFCYEATTPGKGAKPPRGAASMLKRLACDEKGFNVFGDKVRDVALGLLPLTFDRNPSNCDEYSVNTAREKAEEILEEVIFDSFLTMLVQNVQTQRNELFKKKNAVPQLLLVGEKVDMFERFAMKKEKTCPELLREKLKNVQWIKNCWETIDTGNIFSLPEFIDWVDKHVDELVSNMKIVPSSSFADYMHTAASDRVRDISK